MRLPALAAPAAHRAPSRSSTSAGLRPCAPAPVALLTGRLTLQLQHRERRVLKAAAEPGAAEGHTLDVAAYLAMATAVDGVLDRSRANPVNAVS